MSAPVAIGNKEELAFLDQLMADTAGAGDAVADNASKADDSQQPSHAQPANTTSDPHSAAKTPPHAEQPAPMAAVKAEVISPAPGNANELAFLDELAGVKHDPAEHKPSEDAPMKSSGAGDGKDATHEAEGGEQAADAGSADAEGEAEEAEETFERDATELLGAFKDAKPESEEEQKTAEDIMKDFLSDMKAVDRDNEVNRILWAFKLNPFEKLALRFTATESDVRKAYRKISLLIHPDKCSHPQAAAAFEVLGQAQKELLDEKRRENLMRVLEYAREQIHKERRKATKHDSAMRIAATLHEKGLQGVQEAWEETDDFHEKWKMTARDVLAKAEFRRRKLDKRIKEEEERIVAEEKEEAQQRKRARLDKKEWLDNRGSRITSWRDWNKSGKKIKGVKAPKIKTADADRSYVQRATTEQFVGNYKKKPPK